MQKEEKYFQIYEQYRRLAANEDRLLSERVHMLLVGESVFFAGFAIVLANPQLVVLHFIIPIAGIIISILFSVWLIHINNWLLFWLGELWKTEQYRLGISIDSLPEHRRFQHFKDMNESKYWRWIHRYVSPKHIFYWWLPGIFLVVWIAGLIVALLMQCGCL